MHIIANTAFVKEYFEQFFHPSCKYTGWFPGAARVNYSTVRTANDRNGMISLVLHDTELFPDFAMRVVKNKILQREGMTGCQILIEADMSGTLLYEDGLFLNSEESQGDNPVDIKKRALKRGREVLASPCLHGDCCAVAHYGYGLPSTSGDISEQVQIRACLQCVSAQKVLRAQGEAVVSKPMITLHLDEQHHIYFMELHAKCITYL